MTTTVQDIVDTIYGLRDLARELTEASRSSQVEGVPYPAVLADPVALATHAAYLETVANELMTLVPAAKVIVPEDV